jgi:hypothetical protein
MPPALKKLRSTYHASLAKLVADKEKKLQPLLDAYSKSLAALVSGLTRSGRIEDARIVEEKRLAMQIDPNIKRFEGAWDITYSNRAVRHYRIDGSGRVEWTEKRVTSNTQITKKGSDYLIDFNNGQIERITTRGSKLMVEHYKPPDQYPKGTPFLTGTGEKGR